jgi:hypothetical protein
MRLRVAIFVAHEYYILQLGPFSSATGRGCLKLEGRVSATTELAITVTALISTKMSDHFLQSQSSPLQMLLAKSAGACRSRISAIFGWDEFFAPEDSMRNVDPDDRQRPKISFNPSSRQRKSVGIGLAVSRSIVEPHEDSCGQKIILTSLHDSHSSCPW